MKSAFLYYNYKFSKIPKNVLIKLRSELTNKVKRFKLMLFGETVFGFDSTFLLRWLRGAELRKVSSNVKIILILKVIERGKNIIYNLNRNFIL